MRHAPFTRCLTVILFLAGTHAFEIEARADERVIDGRMHHIRHGDKQEWDDFPPSAEDTQLAVIFDAEANETPRTLLIRHRDIKQTWTVELNGKAVAKLPRDENDMLTPIEVAPGLLKAGANTLRVYSGGGAAGASDDIMVGDVRLIDSPVERALNAATVSITVTERVDAERDVAVPCRITVVDEHGALVPLGATSNDRLAVRTGVAYSVDGQATFGVRPGKYTIYAGRGFEYSVDSATLEVAAGRSIARRMSIVREVDTKGLVACDTHVHTFTYSRHGDATLTERMVTLTGEGIELPIATDHNQHIDYETEATRTGMRRWFTPVIGNEVTTQVGHFNVFPVSDVEAKPADWKLPKWKDVFDSIANVPGVRVVILNHGRDVHAGFRPFDPTAHLSIVGERIDGWTPRFNAMELINSAALQTDPMTLYRDWFGLLNRGYSITPIGSSDSHEVSTKIVGQGRTYIEANDSDPAKIDVNAAVDNLIAGRVYVSMGLLTTIKVQDKFSPGDLVVNGSDDLRISVRVVGPSWTRADRVTLYMNGEPVRDERFETPVSDGKSPVVKWSGAWTLPRPKHDAFLVAVATGPGVDAPYWPIARSYQPTSTMWRSYVIGSTGPVWIDGDGDGKRTPAFDYAQRIVAQHGDNLTALIQSLKQSDASTAAQTFNLLRHRGVPPDAPALIEALKDAGPEAKRAHAVYIEQWRQMRRSTP